MYAIKTIGMHGYMQICNSSYKAIYIYIYIYNYISYRGSKSAIYIYIYILYIADLDPL